MRMFLYWWGYNSDVYLKWNNVNTILDKLGNRKNLHTLFEIDNIFNNSELEKKLPDIKQNKNWFPEKVKNWPPGNRDLALIYYHVGIS